MREHTNQAPISEADRLIERGDLLLKGLSESWSRVEQIGDKLFGTTPAEVATAAQVRGVTCVFTQVEDAHAFLKRIDNALARIEHRL